VEGVINNSKLVTCKTSSCYIYIYIYGHVLLHTHARMLHTSGRIDERACSFIRDKKARGRKLRNMPAGRRLRWSNSASHISGHVRACCVSERSIYLSLRFALDRNLSASLDIKSLWFDKLFLQKKKECMAEKETNTRRQTLCRDVTLSNRVAEFSEGP
jgi:hypothetical protein